MKEKNLDSHYDFFNLDKIANQVQSRKKDSNLKFNRVKEDSMKKNRNRVRLWSIVAGVAALSIILTAASVPQDAADTDQGVGYQAQSVETEDNVQIVKPADTARESWPYVELDVEEVRKRGHAGHHEGSCAYGSFNAIIGLLQDEIGAPYDQIPTYMLQFGHGGVAGEGSACGTITGSLAAINLIAGDDYGPLASKLIEYYKTEEFPSDTSNQYAVNHEFPGDDYYDKPLAQTQAPSINCDDSRTTWTEESGYEMSSIERKERCARLTADIAAHAALVLNEWHASELVDVADPQAELSNIFPRASFEQVEGHVHKVMQNGEVIGYAGIGAAPGYKDNIVVAVGIGLDRRVRGVHVVEQNETQGIGSKVAEDDFQSEFEGLTLQQIQLRSAGGRVDGVSGATVSSEAATKAVREQVETLYEYLQ